MIVRAIDGEADRPDDDRISAVFLIALQEDRILAVRNERGWDVPGGHVEAGESLVTALVREVQEEACARFVRAEPCCLVSVPSRQDGMLFFATGEFELSPFSPGSDAMERAVLSIETLLDRYYGPKDILQQIVNSAESVVRKRR